MNRISDGSNVPFNNSLTMMADDTLVEMAKAGGHLAYVELCRRHSSMAMRAVQRITRNKEDAEDVLQESLMKAFIHLRSFDGRAAFSTWLMRIAINSALMLIRKRRNHPETSLEGDLEGGQSYFEISEPSLNPENHLYQREKEHQLRQAVGRLPPRLRVALELRHAQDASVREVAAVIGISVAATKSRLLRARTALRSSLSRQEGSRRRLLNT